MSAKIYSKSKAITNTAKVIAALAVAFLQTVLAAEKQDFSPRPEEQQVPRAMHSRMKELPTITVGVSGADIIGSDNRALQAAVDYIAGLGGGTVEIGAGEFVMHDSLHLRSFVTVRGVRGKTILRKDKAAVSALGLDGDYGEEKVTVVNTEGLKVGFVIEVWESLSGGLHTSVVIIELQ